MCEISRKRTNNETGCTRKKSDKLKIFIGFSDLCVLDVRRKVCRTADILTRVIFSKKPHRRDMWVPVSTTWRFLMLRIEETLQNGG
jgi:hypothetical protein